MKILLAKNRNLLKLPHFSEKYPNRILDLGYSGGVGFLKSIYNSLLYDSLSKRNTYWFSVVYINEIPCGIACITKSGKKVNIMAYTKAKQRRKGIATKSIKSVIVYSKIRGPITCYNRIMSRAIKSGIDLVQFS